MKPPNGVMSLFVKLRLAALCAMTIWLVVPRLGAWPENFFSPAGLAAYPNEARRVVEAIDLDRPGLESAREMAGQQDWLAAAAAVLAWVATQPTIPNQMLPTNDPASSSRSLDAAEAVLAGRFTLQGVTAQVPRRPGGGCDWNWRGPRQDPEWAWLFNRHYFLTDLLAAGRQTGQSQYYAAIDNLLLDWLQANPFPNRLTFSPAWRSLEAARRILDVWPVIWEGMRERTEWRVSTRLLMLAAVLDHATALRDYPSFWGGNHLLTETTALASLAVCWPQFKDVPAWLEIARHRLADEIFAQTYPDGAYKELSNHYQRVVLRNLSAYLRLPIPTAQSIEQQQLLARIETMWDYYATVARGDGFGPLNNAADLENNWADLREVWPIFHRQDWRWLSTGGRQGTRPAGLASRWHRWAGQAVLRSGWGLHDSYAFFDFGPHGSAHQHDDRLHCSFYLDGKDFITDSGRYTYQPGRWREYFKGPAGHNVLRLDGQGARPPPPVAADQPLPAVVSLHGTWDYAAAEAVFASRESVLSGGARHRRALIRWADNGWVVLDEIWPSGLQNAEVLWHFHPDRKVFADHGAVRTRDPSGSNLALWPVGSEPWTCEPIAGREGPEPQGWYSADYNQKLPATCVRFQKRVSTPTLVAWIVWAVRADASDLPRAALTGQPGGDIVLRLDFSNDYYLRFHWVNGLTGAVPGLETHPALRQAGQNGQTGGPTGR